MSTPSPPSSDADPHDDDPSSRAALKSAWQRMLEQRFDGADLFRFWAALGPHFDEGSLLREIGRVAAADAKSAAGPVPLVLENVEDWRTTTRIDGVLPLNIPLASDITTLGRTFGLGVEGLYFPPASARLLDALQEEWAICLLAWWHGRCLTVDFEMEVELRTACPRSATSRKQELTIMATLPNGSRTTVFYSRLTGKDWLAMPESAVEHVEVLEAQRQPESGRLCLIKKA